MWKKRIIALVLLLAGLGIAFFVYKTEPKLNKNFDTQASFFKSFPFKLGLDLSGGTHLVYKADLSSVKSGDVADSMNSLRDVIERRINIFGVSEPVVQVESGSFAASGEERLIVDLPGITDVSKAVEMIGQTPLLEFRVEDTAPKKVDIGKGGNINLDASVTFLPTDLTGRYLDKALLEFDQNTGEPKVSLKFDSEGTKLFSDITKNNIGKMVAIYLDGAPISTPVVREQINTGDAVISGNFTPQEAKMLVGRLNSGALPVPISLLSTQTIGATLGEKAVNSGLKAGLIGFAVIALFLILWYRLPGLIASISLSIYVTLMLALFKSIPVTLTASGIAGFIISLGLAVDANVLIFERIKEEMNSGRNISDALSAGFSRAWSSIRDSNISSIITALILFWFGTSLIKGFALTLGIGVLVSMLSAIIITKLFLISVNLFKENKFSRFLFSSGISK